RPEESAGRRAPAHGDEELARARTDPARAGGEGVAQGRRAAFAVARRRRHRLARARKLTPKTDRFPRTYGPADAVHRPRFADSSLSLSALRKRCGFLKIH